MSNFIFPMEADVKLDINLDASRLMEDVLSDEGDENLVYTSFMLSPAHKAMIDRLSKSNRLKKAATVRAIIEEWCKYRLEEAVSAQ